MIEIENDTGNALDDAIAASTVRRQEEYKDINDEYHSKKERLLIDADIATKASERERDERDARYKEYLETKIMNKLDALFLQATLRSNANFEPRNDAERHVLQRKRVYEALHSTSPKFGETITNPLLRQKIQETIDENEIAEDLESMRRRQNVLPLSQRDLFYTGHTSLIDQKRHLVRSYGVSEDGSCFWIGDESNLFSLGDNVSVHVYGCGSAVGYVESFNAEQVTIQEKKLVPMVNRTQYIRGCYSFAELASGHTALHRLSEQKHSQSTRLIRAHPTPQVESKSLMKNHETMSDDSHSHSGQSTPKTLSN